MRSPEETERIYGDANRRAWMRYQPCIFCRRRPCVSAHIRNGGTGRKADASETVPMCSECHDRYDGRKKAAGRRTFLREIGWTMAMVEDAAVATERRFQMEKLHMIPW